MKEKRKEYHIRKKNKGKDNGKANVVEKSGDEKGENRYHVDCIP
jgi:hypothetical protein